VREKLCRCAFLLQFLRFDQEHPYVVHVEPRVGERPRADVKQASAVRLLPITAFVLPYTKAQSQAAETTFSAAGSVLRINGAERVLAVGGASFKPVQWKIPMPPQRKSSWGFGHIERCSVTSSSSGLGQFVFCDDQEAMRRLLWY
jgi:hypothetical protein